MKKKMEGKSRIVLVDDHPVVRQGLAQILELEGDLHVCGQASSAAEAIGLLDTEKPDLAVVDLSLGNDNGLDLIKDLRQQFPNVKVLALSMLDEMFYAQRALRAGAHGYVMKEAPNEDVLAAIRQILAGKVYLNEKLSSKILQEMVGGKTADPSPASMLSDRELEVFELIGKGLSTRQIANQLHLSAKTVEAHRANMKSKLKLEESSQLLQQAIHWMSKEQWG